ncbi:MAG: hypothetical protein U0797_20545 [Gemmataceae bacterium]
MEELIPTLQHLLSVFLDKFPYPVQILPAEAAAALQPDGVEPELRFAIVTLDMNVRGLATVAGVEEESKRPDPQRFWHAVMLLGPFWRSKNPEEAQACWTVSPKPEIQYASRENSSASPGRGGVEAPGCRMPRIVSLIASATEITCALGFEDQLVGRSHECDHPPGVKRLPVCTAPKLNVHAPSGEIDRQVKTLVEKALAVYDVDAALLERLEPDVIVTQSQCEVCAVSLRDVERAVCTWLERCPRIVSLKPDALADVWRDIEDVAAALGAMDRGAELIERLQARMSLIVERPAG